LHRFIAELYLCSCWKSVRCQFSDCAAT
jgi:hypothetical protein